MTMPAKITSVTQILHRLTRKPTARQPAIVVAQGRAPLGSHVVGQPGRCPACGTSAWHVGNITAECAGCGCALPVHGQPVALR